MTLQEYKKKADEFIREADEANIVDLRIYLSLYYGKMGSIGRIGNEDSQVKINLVSTKLADLMEKNGLKTGTKEWIANNLELSSYVVKHYLKIEPLLRLEEATKYPLLFINYYLNRPSLIVWELLKLFKYLGLLPFIEFFYSVFKNVRHKLLHIRFAFEAAYELIIWNNGKVQKKEIAELMIKKCREWHEKRRRA